jgi:hypothetical protein
MTLLRTALLVVLALLPARAWSQAYDAAGPRELYHAEVCNQGQIKLLVAVAYKDFGFTDEFWVIDYWYGVEPGKCRLVFSHFYAPNNLFSFQSFPLYLAFTFTDSTGVRGAAKINPPRDTAASRVNLCASIESYKYRVNGKTPEAPRCPKGPTPVSFVWEPTRGVYPNAYSREYPPPKRFTVALGPNDRAIPIGPQAPSAPVTQGPGDKMDLHKALQDIMREPGAPKPRISGKYILQVCVPPTVVKKESWANPPSARTKAFKETVRQFLLSHSFGAVTEGIARVRVTEAGSKFVAEEVRACPNDFYFGVWSHHSDEQRAAAPPPAVKPAPQPTPGFGDQMGPGGFIKPLPR